MLHWMMTLDDETEKTVIVITAQAVNSLKVLFIQWTVVPVKAVRFVDYPEVVFGKHV